jgi:putative transposase
MVFDDYANSICAESGRAMTPRGARVVVEGGVYHVLTRSNNKQPVFRQEADYRRYLELLCAYAATHALRVRHFALLPDHVHLILEPAARTSLSRAMLSLNLAYALYYRKRYGYEGHLWRGRFTSLLLDPDIQLLEHARYIELHPVRSGLAADPSGYAWSSYRAYAEGILALPAEPHEPYERLGATPKERCDRYRRFVLQGLRTPPLDPRLPIGRRRRGRPRRPEPPPPVYVKVLGVNVRQGLLSLLSGIW